MFYISFISMMLRYTFFYNSAYSHRQLISSTLAEKTKGATHIAPLKNNNLLNVSNQSHGTPEVAIGVALRHNITFGEVQPQRCV